MNKSSITAPAAIQSNVLFVGLDHQKFLLETTLIDKNFLFRFENILRTILRVNGILTGKCEALWRCLLSNVNRVYS